jgi:hypothetical protein
LPCLRKEVINRADQDGHEERAQGVAADVDDGRAGR